MNKNKGSPVLGLVKSGTSFNYFFNVSKAFCDCLVHYLYLALKFGRMKGITLPILTKNNSDLLSFLLAIELSLPRLGVPYLI